MNSSTSSGYRQVADDLRAAIERGDYSPGDALPEHRDLAQHYNLSLSSVSRAVRVLASEGLVAPARGHGTVVRDRTPFRLPVDRYTTSSPQHGPWETACAHQGLDGYTEVTDVSEQPADELVARELEIEPGTTVIHRLNEMYLGRHVAQLQETFLPYSLVANTPFTGREIMAAGIYKGLTDIGHPPAIADETVISRMPTKREADVLRLPPGTPVLDIRRTSRRADNQPLLHTHLVLAGDRVSLTSRYTF
jgi:GntR family transcriptional regulator